MVLNTIIFKRAFQAEAELAFILISDAIIEKGGVIYGAALMMILQYIINVP